MPESNDFQSKTLTATEYFRLPVGLVRDPIYLGELRRDVSTVGVYLAVALTGSNKWKKLLTDVDLPAVTVYTSDNGITKVGNNFELGGALTKNTSITGSFSLGIDIASLNITNSGTCTFTGNATNQIELNNIGLKLSNTSASNANFTITVGMIVISLPTITANRTITFPVPTTNGKILEIYNTNNSAFTWNIAGASVITPNGTSLTSLLNQEYYKFTWIGSSWVRTNNYSLPLSASAPLTLTGSVLSITQSNGSTNGFLSSTDWTTFNNKVSTTRAINTTGSLTGGGNLSADRTLQLVNDNVSPGVNKIYGTNGSGIKGWYDQVVAGIGTVTSVGVSSTDLSVSGSPITTNGNITLNINNDAVTFAKMQNIITASLIGRYSSGTGDPQTITLGSGLSLSPTGVLSASVGGVGTVTSVGLSMPSAFTVTNSPVVSSGTLTVTGAGNTSQYIRGDGSLATFPAVGEVNTGSNLGSSGAQVFSSKVGADLRFRRIIGTGGTTVVQNTNDITLSSPQQLNLVVNGAGILTGTYPNLTLDILSGGGGTVTSIGMSVPSGLSVSPSLINSSGTFSVTTTLNGLIRGTGSGFATTTVSPPLVFSAGTLSITQASTSVNGFLSSADWNTFNNKVPTTRSITGTGSVSGGGDLSINRSLSLVNDNSTPGNNKLYGTNASGIKGWYDQPASGSTYTGTSPISVTGSTISISLANSSTNGYLSNSDWSIFNGKVSPSREINTINSIIGGGDLSANRNIQLVNDQNSPGSSKYYGTSSFGIKGWYDLPSSSSGSFYPTAQYYEGYYFTGSSSSVPQLISSVPMETERIYEARLTMLAYNTNTGHSYLKIVKGLFKRTGGGTVTQISSTQTVETTISEASTSDINVNIGPNLFFGNLGIFITVGTVAPSSFKQFKWFVEMKYLDIGLSS